MPSSPAPAPAGEYWDSLAYQMDGTPAHNQDAHRQRIVNWIEAAGGLATAFGEEAVCFHELPFSPCMLGAPLLCPYRARPGCTLVAQCAVTFPERGTIAATPALVS